MNIENVKAGLHPNGPTLEDLKKADPYTYNEIFELNTYGFHRTDVDGADVVDIGAHKGYFTTLAAAQGARMVLAVEPNRSNFDILIKNVSMYHHVHPINMACLNGWIDEVESFDKDGTAKVRPGTGVQARSLEQFCNLLPSRYNRRVLKMDCEGSEFDILLAADIPILRTFEIVFFEVHGQGEDERSVKFIKDYLRFAGFEQAFLHPVMWTTFGPDGKPVGHEKIKDIEILKFKRV